MGQLGLGDGTGLGFGKVRVRMSVPVAGDSDSVKKCAGQPLGVRLKGESVFAIVFAVLCKLANSAPVWEK